VQISEELFLFFILLKAEKYIVHFLSVLNKEERIFPQIILCANNIMC